jgi:hypothetical protein
MSEKGPGTARRIMLRCLRVLRALLMPRAQRTYTAQCQVAMQQGVQPYFQLPWIVPRIAHPARSPGTAPPGHRPRRRGARTGPSGRLARRCIAGSPQGTVPAPPRVGIRTWHGMIGRGAPSCPVLSLPLREVAYSPTSKRAPALRPPNSGAYMLCTEHSPALKSPAWLTRSSYSSTWVPGASRSTK